MQINLSTFDLRLSNISLLVLERLGAKMKRVRLVVAYDGTNYCGWQIQPENITVEKVLTDALKELLKEDIILIGASRTDSGVHALGNVAVFNTETKIPAEKIALALNQRLPEDIRIQSSDQVEDDWHPRYQESIKTYEYKILNRKIQNPLLRNYTHFLYTTLDVELMQKAAAYIVGEHDFASFCSSGSQVKTTVRTIYSLDVTKTGDVVSIKIAGNGFLYNMVRIIAGTLIQVGTGLYAPEYVKSIIEKKDRGNAGPTAPAKGLTLVKIDYPSIVKLGVDR